MTEDSDDKERLGDRGFKLGYKDLGVSGEKTTADEVTSMTDGATESAIDDSTSEATSAPEMTSQDEFKAADETTEEADTQTQTDTDS